MKERPILFSAPMVRALMREENPKTQTRRILKPQPLAGEWVRPLDRAWLVGRMRDSENAWRHLICPYGQPGDRLWVRETWIYRGAEAHFGGGKEPWAAAWVKYPADGTERTIPRPVHDNSGVPSQRRPRAGESAWDYNEYLRKWFHTCRPSIHMPRWASRLTLEVTGVRVERLQDITEADAIAEGVEKNAIHLEDWVPADGWRHYGYPPDYQGEGYEYCLTARESYRTLWESINGAGSWDANPWVWVVEFRRAS